MPDTDLDQPMKHGCNAEDGPVLKYQIVHRGSESVCTLLSDPCFAKTSAVPCVLPALQYRRGGREIIYLSLHCHHQKDSCIKMGSDESHFNVSVLSEGQSHETASTNHNLFEEKGEPKRYRTEVFSLTSLMPYR